MPTQDIDVIMNDTAGAQEDQRMRDDSEDPVELEQIRQRIRIVCRQTRRTACGGRKLTVKRSFPEPLRRPHHSSSWTKTTHLVMRFDMS